MPLRLNLTGPAGREACCAAAFPPRGGFVRLLANGGYFNIIPDKSQRQKRGFLKKNPVAPIGRHGGCDLREIRFMSEEQRIGQLASFLLKKHLKIRKV